MAQTELSPDVSLTFYISQNGKKVIKKVLLPREKLLEYTAMNFTKWSEMYERIVADKSYISITDHGNSN